MIRSFNGVFYLKNTKLNSDNYWKKKKSFRRAWCIGSIVLHTVFNTKYNAPGAVLTMYLLCFLIGHVTYMVKRKMRCWKNLITVPK